MSASEQKTERPNDRRKYYYFLAASMMSVLLSFYITSSYDLLKSGTDQAYQNTYACYHRQLNDLAIDHLEDIQLSKRQPTLDRSIFFVITTCINDSFVDIQRREACAIESAARHNPDRDIFVVFASPVGFAGDKTSDPFYRLTRVPETIKTLSSFQNVQLRNVNLTTFVHGTPMEELKRAGSIYRSSWPSIHLADLLRLLMLHRYGGICMDSDVIAMRSFDDLSPIFLASEEGEILNNAVMGTTHDGFGHGFFHEMIGEGAKGYDSNVLNTIGRDMVRRFLQHKCRMAKPADDNSKCPDMKIYPQNVFHPFTQDDDKRVWNKTRPNQEIMDRIQNSYAIQLSSSRSNAVKLTRDDRSVINVVAEKNCPAVYCSADTFNN